jgi:hypothetical protein
VEQRHIRTVLEQMHGNKRRAARALGLSRSTLDRKLAADRGPGSGERGAGFGDGASTREPGSRR